MAMSSWFRRSLSYLQCFYPMSFSFPPFKLPESFFGACS
ncbi:unnamed protein product [Brassica oleracea]